VLGDIFEVRFELPPHVAALTSEWRYVVVPDNERLAFEDVMMKPSSRGGRTCPRKRRKS
jgi:hypothetical protein